MLYPVRVTRHAGTSDRGLVGFSCKATRSAGSAAGQSTEYFSWRPGDRVDVLYYLSIRYVLIGGNEENPMTEGRKEILSFPTSFRDPPNRPILSTSLRDNEIHSIDCPGKCCQSG